jgi:hypothetical protein
MLGNPGARHPLYIGKPLVHERQQFRQLNSV